jgi:hypothetical protein
MPLDEADLEATHQELDCYVTYAAKIEAHLDGKGIKRNIAWEEVLEICQEVHEPRLESLFEALTSN